MRNLASSIIHPDERTTRRGEGLCQRTAWHDPGPCRPLISRPLPKSPNGDAAARTASVMRRRANGRKRLSRTRWRMEVRRSATAALLAETRSRGSLVAFRAQGTVIGCELAMCGWSSLHVDGCTQLPHLTYIDANTSRVLWEGTLALFTDPCGPLLPLI